MQTITGISPPLLPRCLIYLTLHAIINTPRTVMLTYEGHGHLFCLQWILWKFYYPREWRCSLLQPRMVQHLLWLMHCAHINERNQIRGWTEQRRMRNSDSGHQCWVITLSFIFFINQRLEEDISKYAPLHRDHAKTQINRDAEVIELAINGQRKTRYSTTIETRSCSCPSLHNSQAQEMTQPMLTKQLK